MKTHDILFEKYQTVQKLNESHGDVISMDVPLLIRLLEYAKEDAKTDMDLHRVAEKLIEQSKVVGILDMSVYEKVVVVSE